MLTKKYKNLLVVKTFSKGYSLAGIRCGYAVGDAALIEGLCRCKDCFNSYPVDRVCQAVCAAVDGSYHVRRAAQTALRRFVQQGEENAFRVCRKVEGFAHSTAEAEQALYNLVKEETEDLSQAATGNGL